MSCWELAAVMYQVMRQALSIGKSSRTTRRRRKLVRTHDVVVLFLLIRNNIELWTIFHDELDLDGNGHLDSEELALALGKAGELTSTRATLFITICAGITLTPQTLAEFMTTLTSSPHSHAIRYEKYTDGQQRIPPNVTQLFRI
jgi:hypothetical protein